MFISEIETAFEKELKGRSGQVFDWTHFEKGPARQDLRTLFHVIPGNPEQLLVSISGTHGPEGFIGSRIQTEILRQLGSHPKVRPTVLFIHNLNCFGSAWVRRVNHQNIDLNRNSWTGQPPQNTGYLIYSKWLSSASRLRFWMHLVGHLPSLPRVGLQHVSSVIAQGQSQEPKSLFYTGIEIAPELRQLDSVLKAFHPKQVFVLDVHTGLGPFTHESLMLETRIGEPIQSALTKSFDVPILDLSRETAFYVAVGGLSNLFKRAFPLARVCYFTQEFGTFRSLRVLEQMVLENSAWQSGQWENKKRFEQMLQTFFPSSSHWQRAVRAAGVQRFFQLANSIAEL